MASAESNGLFSILVVGGGIAGLATAVALRAPKRKIIVLEQSRMNKEVGALISLQPNASKIATKLGLDSFLASKGPMIDRGFCIFNTKGELQKKLELSTEMYGADRVVYHRQDLHESLKEAATSSKLSGLPVEIRVASRVVKCNCEEGLVETETGETFKADLVVGADGIHSVMRNAVIGTAQDYEKSTGLSAYRLLFSPEQMRDIPGLETLLDVTKSVTTMIFGPDKRIVMGPGRNATLYGIIALLPDKDLNEDTTDSTWTSQGSVNHLLESFKDFPEPMREVFRRAGSNGPSLWQLRDIDPLQTWVKGRTIIIGDAAHAMLPLQGQGASQSFEDAEALQAFFADVAERPTSVQVHERLEAVFKTRYARASLIQGYSRASAKPATEDSDTTKVKLTTTEFMDYNCKYDGAIDWQRQQRLGVC